MLQDKEREMTFMEGCILTFLLSVVAFFAFTIGITFLWLMLQWTNIIVDFLSGVFK